MKPGFGSGKGKKKKANKKKGKGDKPKGDDAAMEDAAAVVSSEEVDVPITEEAPSAKVRQTGRMVLKKALKVKVSALKQARAKLTKVPGNKVQRQEVSEAKVAALSELAELGKDKTTKKQGATAKKNAKKNAKRKAGKAAKAAGEGAATMES